MAVTLHSEVVDSVSTWKSQLNAFRVPFTTDIETRRTAHRAWWADFWNRSYIFASGDGDATDLTQKYVLTRYRQACAGRTPGMPIRFAGSLFTVGNGSDPDWVRANPYHAFNQRFVFWGMLPSGDFDLMQPFFDQYANSLHLARDRVFAWWGPATEGAMWPVRINIFGNLIGQAYGWSRRPVQGRPRNSRNEKVPPSPVYNSSTRHLYTGNTEMVAMLLDRYDYSRDADFARRRLLPLAKEVLTFYFTNWEVVGGKLFLDNLYSGEEDWNMDNPTADVSGLRKMLAGLLALPHTLTTPAERADWTTKQGQLPAIPIADGKFKTADNLPNSLTINASATGPPWPPVSTTTRERNNQNLYPIFPFRLYGYGQADLATATKSFNERFGRSGGGPWRHDATHAAYLGLIEQAKTFVLGSLGQETESGWRFPTFSDGQSSGDPSVERPAIGKIAFQAMLMHPGAGDNINLLNAWPSNWDVEFKLHAPKGTVVKGSRAGNHIAYTATPASRASDVSVRGSLTVNERLALSVDAVAGDDVVDSTEKARGFQISGNTGSVNGATVAVSLGDTVVGSATSVRGGAWSVAVPANAAYLTGNSLALRVTASRPGYLDAAAVERTVTTDALALNVSVIARDDTVNIAEKAAGFAISGHTGSVGGVTVTVTVGAEEFTATSAEADPATWSVSVPADASYISEPSVAVTVSAEKTGYTPSLEARVLAVDLTAPTAPTYAAPSSLQQGVAIAAINPSGGLGIAWYSAVGLPSGLRIDLRTGAIVGTPDTVAGAANVTVIVFDTGGNPATVQVQIAFPAVAPFMNSFSAGDLIVSVSYRGRITAFTGPDGTNFLASGYSPALLKFIVADSAGVSPSSARQLLPTSVRFLTDSSTYVLSFDYGIEARVQLGEEGEYATLELHSFSNPQHKDIRVAMWGPYELTIGEQVADVVGIAYSRDYAIGIQALNVKTFAGAPYEFTDSNHMSSFDASARVVDPELGSGIGGTRVALNKYWLSAARLTSFGSVLQAYSRDYTKDRFSKTLNIEGPHTYEPARVIPAIIEPSHPLYPYRALTESKIALFGLQRRGVEGGGLNRRQVFKREILETIYRLERAEGLPYTTGNGGLYAKLGDDVQQKVLQFRSYATSSSDVISAGMDSQYHWTDHGGFFTHNGFNYNVKAGGGSYETLRNNISNSWKKGVLSGNHYLPGFAYFGRHGSANVDLSADPIERDITSKPDQIAETTRTTLVRNITQSATAIVIKGRDDRFRQYHFKDSSPKRGLARMGSEIIAYTGAVDHGTSDTRLTGAIRGILRTRATRHTIGSKVHALRFWNHYNAFSWGDRSVQAQGIALGNSINDTGMQFASLDGIESYWDDSIGELAANVLYKNLHNTMTSKEFLGEASRLWHYNWHFHNRFMWGEAPTQALQGTVFYQLANMVMMARNFLPAHTGGFFAEADNRIINSPDDFEWVDGKVAAHNAGILVRSSGLNDDHKAVLKSWNQAQEAGAFSDYHRVRMGPWQRAFALEEVNNGSADWKTGQRWRLKERALTLNYSKVNEADDDKNTIMVTSVNYGEETNPFYVARPWAGFPTRNVAGDALVSTSSKQDAGYQGDNAVDGFIGMFNPGSRYDFCRGSNHYRPESGGGIRCRSGWVPGSTSEWHTASGDSERWIKLTWDRPQRIRTVFLSDRSHPDNNVTGYTIEFENGTSMSGTNLPIRGRYAERSVPVGSVESTWVKVTITSHAGSNPGLGEVAVIAEDRDFEGHLAKNARMVARPSKLSSQPFGPWPRSTIVRRRHRRPPPEPYRRGRASPVHCD